MKIKAKWHNLSSEEVIKNLNSDNLVGLTNQEVKNRQKKYGFNKLPEEKSLSQVMIFLMQFKSPLIYILILAGIITIIFKEYTDAIVIFLAVLLNSFVGFIQESKSSKALHELKKVLSVQAIVVRDNHEKQVLVEDLVPGDIVLLRAGDKVPADARLIECHNLKVNESALTGEWLPATKKEDFLSRETPLADRDNMVYMGTAIEDGRARAIIVATGSNTEIGQVTNLVRNATEEQTPYQQKIAKFSKWLVLVIGLICLFVFLRGMLMGGDFIEMFTVVVALAVASIPEGLPIAMTVILALGMQRILKRKGLVRSLAAAETLGSTTIIATDKTGTLTQAKMSVAGIYTFFSSDDEEKLALKQAILSSEAFVENPEEHPDNWEVRGMPTEKALIMEGLKFELLKNQLEIIEPQIDQIPFSSVYKYSASLRKITDNKVSLDAKQNADHVLYVKGAPEIILEKSRYVKDNHDEQILDHEKRQKLMNKYQELTGQGYRVLGVAYKKIPGWTFGSFDLKEAVSELVFVGFVYLEDPIRPQAKEAIQTCFRAGMRPIIITGDHKLTAKAVANKLGLKVNDDNILEGWEMEKMSDKQLSKILNKIKIYARVEPKHKMRIIEAWQRKGEVVAMTGDGINDAPAIKQANIGVALGSGTEVAKSVSDLVLLSDDFSIIVAAVEEGRAIIDNVRKVISYLLAYSFTEIFLISGSIILGLPLPITAVQILWINLIEDSLPAVALSFEKREIGSMNRPPHSNQAPLLNNEMKVMILAVGLITNLLLFGLFYILLSSDLSLDYIQTIIFTCLTISALLYVFSCKSLRKNIWQINIFDNKILLSAWLFGLVSLIAGIYIPIFNKLLGTVPLPFSVWPMIVALGIFNVMLIEAVKYYFIARHQTEK